MKKRLIILCAAQSLLLFAPPKNKKRAHSLDNQVINIQNSTENEDTLRTEASVQEQQLTSSRHSFRPEGLPPGIKASSNFILDAPSNSPQEDKHSFSKKADDEESYDDLNSLNDQNHRGTNLYEQFIITAHSCAQSAEKIAAQCGILSRIKYYNKIVNSQQAHADYIASTATAANPHKGYHDLENAILEAISNGAIANIKAALDLFNNIYPYKSYLTPQALKKISDASVKYQEHLDFEHRSTVLTYLEQTRLTTFLKAEADKVDGASNFATQEDTALLQATEKTVKHLKHFASQSKATQNENDDDFRNDDE